MERVYGYQVLGPLGPSLLLNHEPQTQALWKTFQLQTGAAGRSLSNHKKVAQTYRIAYLLKDLYNETIIRNPEKVGYSG